MAHRQRPVQPEVQADIAAKRLRDKQERWASQGYNSPVYNQEPNRRGPSFEKARQMGQANGLLRELFGLIIRNVADQDTLNKRGFRGSSKER